MPDPLSTPTPGRLAVSVAYFLIYVVWGSTYYAIGVALRGFPPFLLGGLRFAAAGTLLLCICLLRKENVFKRGLILKSAVSGIVLLFVDMAVIMLAQQYLSSSLVAILASSTALWILILDVPKWKTNFRMPTVGAGIVLGFAGVVLLYAEQWRYGEPGAHGEYGVALLALGCVSWSLGTLYAQYKSSAEEKTNGFAGAAWQMLFAGTAFWVCSLALGEMRGGGWGVLPSSAWVALGYLIVFGSILAYTSYIWLLKVRSAAEVGTHAYANPLVAVLLGATLGGEEISGVQWAGLGAILAGIFLIRKPAGTNRLSPASLSDLSPCSNENQHHATH